MYWDLLEVVVVFPRATCWAWYESVYQEGDGQVHPPLEPVVLPVVQVHRDCTFVGGSRQRSEVAALVVALVVALVDVEVAKTVAAVPHFFHHVKKVGGFYHYVKRVG